MFLFSKGKLEALAILLQKLRSESRRVLIFTQMAKMLDILEAFLDHRQLTYVRLDESFTSDERQVRFHCYLKLAQTSHLLALWISTTYVKNVLTTI